MTKETGTRLGNETGAPWWNDPRDATPWMPEDRDQSLANTAVEIIAASSRLEGALPKPARTAVAALLRFVNSYCSNLIEGHATLPRDIERAMHQSYDQDPSKRNLQIEARVHVDVDRRMRQRLIDHPEENVASEPFLRRLHHDFFKVLPSEMRIAKGANGKESTVIPGQLRAEEVVIGAHLPPTHTSVQEFLAVFAKEYDLTRMSRTQAVIAAAASHHRLAWIHPFLDGNGRVARLFTQAYFMRAGVDAHGVWSISRGLARKNQEYRVALAGADAQRAGDFDGRGNLTDAGLHGFCKFFLNVALDQITFIESLLRLDGLLDRLSTMAELAESKKALPPRTGMVLREAMLRGPLSRGEALELFGQAERTARQHLATVLESGLLIPEGISHRVPVAFAVPTAYGAQLFPGLYPHDSAKSGNDDGAEDSLITKLRLMSMPAMKETIEELIGKYVYEIENDDLVSNCMAETNATGYGVDEWEMVDADDFDLGNDDEVRVPISFHVTGEFDDRPMTGNEIFGSAIAIIHPNKSVSFEVTSADVKH